MGDERTTDLLVLWDEARRLGKGLSPVDLCPDDPERQARLRRRIQDLERLYGVFEVAGPPPSSAGASEGGSPTTIAGLHILEELGRGGMAVVFKAHQPALNRIVAVKMIVAGLYNHPEQIARFLAEAEAIARLGHPHVVAIHELAEHDGCPVLVLEYMPGGTLAQQFAGAPQPPAEAARLLESLARAMHYAHGNGIVHRDLKPANILISAAGVPKVADFGLAKLRDDDSGATRTGDLLGTPSYMAPEQAAGRSKATGPATDVYALGAILYEALTGRPPFRGTTKPETLEMVRTQDPVAPRRLQPRIPRDLETICMTCLQKEPRRRYSSAEDLADDLQRHLGGFPIRARRAGFPEHAVRWMRRHPTVTTAAVSATILMLVLVIGGLRAEREADRRETASRVRTLVHTLETIETARVPDYVGELEPYRDLAAPLLREVMDRSSVGSRERLHAALALLPSDPRMADYLADCLLTAAPEELAVLRDALAHRGPSLRPRLWDMLGDVRRDNGLRLRAACALAVHEADDPRWAAAGPDLARILAMENPLTVGRWADLLRAVADRLLPTLADLLADDRHGAPERRAISSLYETLARDVPDGYTPLEGRLAGPIDAANLKDGGLDAARSRAVVAASLLIMGRADLVWPLLRHSPDPTVRSYLIERLAAAGVDPLVLIARLRVESDVSIRRALVLALGEYDPVRTVIPDREALADELLGQYRHEADAGLHGALQWLLDRWGQSDRVRQIDRETKLTLSQDRRWFVNSQGQGFSIIIAPGRSGPAAAGQRSGEYRFALAAKEVTPYQFRRFLSWLRNPRRPAAAAFAAEPIDWDDPFAKHSPPDRIDGPALGVLWHEAAAYCNWLSRQEGIPEDQWCYVATKVKGGGRRLTPAPNSLERAGYRLPTVEEWSLACIAGASTPLAFGRCEELLSQYAWCYGNARMHAWPVGMLKPNDLGLFDLYGNAWEYCDSFDGPARRVLCGGSFLVPAGIAILRDTNNYPPMLRGESVGFRPARTIAGLDSIPGD